MVDPEPCEQVISEPDTTEACNSKGHLVAATTSGEQLKSEDVYELTWSSNYLFGQESVLPYKGVFVLMHFLGAIFPLAVVWAMGDIALAIVIVPNLIALILLTPKVVEETKSYFERKPWEENERKRAELARRGKI